MPTPCILQKKNSNPTKRCRYRRSIVNRPVPKTPPQKPSREGFSSLRHGISLPRLVLPPSLLFLYTFALPFKKESICSFFVIRSQCSSSVFSDIAAPRHLQELPSPRSAPWPLPARRRRPLRRSPSLPSVSCAPSSRSAVGASLMSSTTAPLVSCLPWALCTRVTWR